jgi:hypothetical protein
LSVFVTAEAAPNWMMHPTHVAVANAVFAATGVRVRNLPIARTSLATGSAALGQVVI